MTPDWMCPECGHAINHHAPYSRVVGCMEEYDAICGCRRIWRDAEEQLAALLEAVAPLLAAADEAVTYMDDEFAREDLALAADALRDLLGPTGGEA